MKGRDHWFLVLVALVVGHFIFSAPQIVYPHFELNYPFSGGDKWDWLSNGLALAGYDVRYSARPPLLPLLLAFLERFSILSLFPIVLQAIVSATTLGLYRHLRGDYPRHIAFAVAVTIGFNFHWRSFSLDVMADVLATCLLTWSVFFWRRSSERSGAYVPAGLLAGLSAVTQQTALLMPVPACLSMVCFRRGEIRSRPFVLGATLFLLPTIFWTVYKYLTFGTAGDVLVNHWSLLTFSIDAIGDYLFHFVSYFGLPAAVLIGLGWLPLCRKARRDAWGLFLVSLVAVILIFFVLFYDHISIRFLTYIFLVSAIPLAESLNRIRAQMLFWPVVGTVALASLLPLPVGRASGQAMLWPLPPIFAQAPLRPSRNGGRALEFSKLELKGVRVSDLVRQSYEYRILRRNAEPLKNPFPFETLKGDDSALFFHDESSSREHRNVVDVRLGVQLRKRVKYLPWSAFPPEFFRQRVRLTRVGGFEHFSIYRAWPAGLEGSWLFIAVTGGPADRQLGSISHDDDGSPRSPAPELFQARALSQRIGTDHPVIFADPEGRDRWRLYLPFLLPTTQFFLIEPEQVPDARRIWLERSKVLDRTSIAGVQMTRYRLLGGTWIVMEDES